MEDKKIISKLKQELQYYKRLSYHDPLTGLYNYRKFKKDIRRYLEEIKRYKFYFYVVLIDIDNFKNYNDKKGHKFGDKVLKICSRVIKNNIRKIDKAYRLYGGDEFVIILKYTDHDTCSERIKYCLTSKFNINISIGGNKLNKNIFNLIDKKMYKEKRKKKDEINN